MRRATHGSPRMSVVMPVLLSVAAAGAVGVGIGAGAGPTGSAGAISVMRSILARSTERAVARCGRARGASRPESLGILGSADDERRRRDPDRRPAGRSRREWRRGTLTALPPLGSPVSRTYAGSCGRTWGRAVVPWSPSKVRPRGTAYDLARSGTTASLDVRPRGRRVCRPRADPSAPLRAVLAHQPGACAHRPVRADDHPGARPGTQNGRSGNPPVDPWSPAAGWASAG